MATHYKHSRFLLAAAIVLAATLLARGPASAPQASAACADTVIVRAVKTYTIDSTSPVTIIEPITLTAIPGRRFLLEVLRPGGTNPLTSAQVAYGTAEYFGTQDVDATNVLLSRVVTPQGAASLTVTLTGSAGAKLDLRITQVPEPLYTIYSPAAFTGATAEKWYTKYFSPAEGDPPSPHVLTLTNGNADLTGSARASNPEVWLNSQQIVFPGEVTTGRAFVTRNVTLEAANTLQVKLQAGQGNKKISLKFSATDASAPDLLVTSPADSFVTSAATVPALVQVTDAETAVRLRLDGVDKPLTGGAWSGSLALPAQDGRTTFTFVAENGACLTDTVRQTVFRDTHAPMLEILSPQADTVVTTGSVIIVGRWLDSTLTRITVDDKLVIEGTSGPSYVAFQDTVSLDFGANGFMVRAVDAAGNVSQIKRFILRTTGEAAHRDSAALGETPIALTEISAFRDQIAFIFQGGNPVQSIQYPESIATGRESVIRGLAVARDFGPLPNVKITVKDHPEFGWTESRSDGRFDLVVSGGQSYTLRFTMGDFLESQRQVFAPPLDYAVLDTVAMIGRSQRWYYADTTQSRTIVGRFESDANGDRQIHLLVPSGALATVTPENGSAATFDKYRIKLKEFTVGSGGRDAMPGQLPPTTAYTYCVDMGLVEADSIVDNHYPGGPPADIVFSKPIVTYVREFLGMPVGTPVPSGYYDSRLGVWVADEDGLIIKVLSVVGSHATLDTDGDDQADSAAQLVSANIDSLELTRLTTLFKAGDILWRLRVTHFSSHDFNYNMASDPEAMDANAPGAVPGVPPVEKPDKTCNCIIENENRVLGETIPVSGTPYSLNYRSNRVPGDRASYWLRVPLTGAIVPPSLWRVHLVVDVAGRHFEKIYTGLGPNEWRMFMDWDGTDGNNRRVPGSVTATVKIGYEFPSEYSVKKSGSGKSFGNPASTAYRPGKDATGDRDARRIEWSTQRVSLGAPSMASAGLGGWTLSPHHFYDTNGLGALYVGDGDVRYGAARRPIIKLFAGTGNQPTGLPSGLQRKSTSMRPRQLTFGPDGSLYFVGGGGLAPHIGRIRPDGTVVTWAGSSSRGTPGDTIKSGQPAVGQKFVGSLDIAIGPDGSLFVSDEGFRQVYRISPGDTIYVLSGSYAWGSGKFTDGSVAAADTLNTPTAIAVGTDGSVYVADQGYQRIVRITPDGFMRSFAGNGMSTPMGTAGKADSLAISRVDDMAVDLAGNVYFLEGQRLWIVRPDGQMKQMSAVVPDHGPKYLALGPDGAIHVGQAQFTGFNGVYRIEPDGSSVTRLAGGFDRSAESQSTSFADNEGAFGIATVMNDITGIAVASDGSAYVSETLPGDYSGGTGIRRIASELPGVSTGEIVYPSEDGREVYYFTPRGQHLRTKDARTGVPLYSFSYNSAGQLTGITDANSQLTQIVRDTQGNPKAIAAPLVQRDSLSLDANGYLARVRNELTNDEYVLGHNADGLLVTFQNPRGKVQSFAYGTGWPGQPGDGRLATDTDARPSTLTLGYQVQDTTRTVTRSSALGRVTTYQITEWMNGLRRQLTRHPDQSYRYRADSTNKATAPFGQVVRDVGPAGEETFTYPKRDPRFGMLAQVPSVVTTKLPSGRIRTLSRSRAYSGTGQFESTTTLNGGTPATSTYDSSGSSRTLLTTTPQNRRTTAWLDGAGRPTGVKVGGLALVSLAYDARGRLSDLSQGARNWHYDYDAGGRLSGVRNALGHTTTFQYDAADRDTAQTLPGGRTVGYRYDANGNLTSLRPPGRPLHEFAYTNVDQNETYTPPAVAGVATPATAYAFNADRQLTDVTRPDGGTVHLEFAAGTGRLTSLTHPRGVNQFTYWDTPQPNTVAGSGQLKTVTSPDGVTCTYAYDGPLLASETWSGAVSGSVAHTYDNAFRDATENVTVGAATSEVSFGYDGDGLLTRAAAVPVGWVYDVHRADSTGLADSTQVGTGAGRVTSSAAYNPHGELAELHYSLAGGALFHQSIQRNVLGQITRIDESWQGGTPKVLEYGYDLAGRLDSVAVDGVVTRRYEYDANGNRTAEKDGSGTTLASGGYDHQDRMQTYGPAAYAYTANGELAKRIVAGTDTTRYTYDALGNLTGAHLPGAGGDSLVYVIDGQNRRVGMQRNGTTERQWLYANGIAPIAELDGAGALVNRYVYATLGHAPDLVMHGDTAYRVVTDQLGSVRAVVRTTDGAVVQRTDYDAWGVITADAGGTFQALGYAGGLTDRTTALVRFGARDYEAATGRWTAKDPVRFRGGDNLYAYVGLDPLNHYDQRGLTFDSNRDFFRDWLTGRGKRNRYYPPGSTESNEMSKSPGAASLRQQFIENGCDDLPDGEFETIEAYFKTILNPTSTGFQVGGFDRAEVINNGNGTITIVITNVAGTHSFFLHAVPDRKDAHGPMSNIHQVFKWTEPLPEECGECPEAKKGP